MDKILSTLMNLQLMVTAPRDDERGQGTLEYVGMVIVAAILVVAVLQATDTVDIAGAFTDAVNSVTGGGE